MLLRPVPFPDEMDRGYLGRLMRMNSLKSEAEAIARTADQFGAKDLSRREMPGFELIAMAAGMTVDEFAKLHSTLPLRLAVSKKPHGNPNGPLSASRLHKISMRPFRPSTYFCCDCVSEDLSFHGVTYWRRSHQICGQLWCPKHLTPLSFQPEGSDFLTSPVDLQKTAKSVSSSQVDQAMKHEGIKVFLDIAACLAMSASSSNNKIVANDLQRRAVHLGFASNCGALEGTSVISKAVGLAFPNFWISETLPAAAYEYDSRANTGVRLKSVDKAISCDDSLPPIWTYILVAAFLFKSADEALNNVFYRPGSGSNVLSGCVRECLHNNEQLVSAYISTKGNYELSAQQLNSTLMDVSGKLSQLGLPNLHSGMVRRKSSLDALAAFYLGQRSIKESAVAGGISSVEMEVLLRKTGSLFASALSAMTVTTTVPQRRLRHANESAYAT